MKKLIYRFLVVLVLVVLNFYYCNAKEIEGYSKQELSIIKQNIDSLQGITKILTIRVDAFSESIDMQACAISSQATTVQWFSGISSGIGVIFLLVSFIGSYNLQKMVNERRNAKELREKAETLLKVGENNNAVFESKVKSLTVFGSESERKVVGLLDKAKIELQAVRGFLNFIAEKNIEINKFQYPSFLYFPFKKEIQNVYNLETIIDFLDKVGHKHRKHNRVKGLASFYSENWERSIDYYKDSQTLSVKEILVLGIAKYKSGLYREAKQDFDSLLMKENNHVIAYKYFALCFLFINGFEISEDDREWEDSDMKIFQRVFMLRELNGNRNRIAALLEKTSSNRIRLRGIIEKELNAKEVLKEINFIKQRIEDQQYKINDKKNAIQESTKRIYEIEELLKRNQIRLDDSRQSKSAIADLETEKFALNEELKEFEVKRKNLQNALNELSKGEDENRLKIKLGAKKELFKEKMSEVFEAGEELESIDYQADIYQKVRELLGSNVLSDRKLNYPQS